MAEKASHPLYQAPNAVRTKTGDHQNCSIRNINNSAHGEENGENRDRSHVLPFSNQDAHLENGGREILEEVEGLDNLWLSALSSIS